MAVSFQQVKFWSYQKFWEVYFKYHLVMQLRVFKKNKYDKYMDF